MHGLQNTSSFADLRRALDALATAPITSFGRGVWIHGAGGMGQSVARALSDAEVPILGFLDRKGRERTSFDGLRVVHPDHLADADVANAFHVHALMNHYAPSRSITDWAACRGFAGLLFPADLHRIPGVSLQNYWLAPAIETLTKIDLIEAVHDALEDEASRALLRSLLLYRLTSDPRLHPHVDTVEAGSLDFLPIFERPITFVDGGAYTGDSLELLLRLGVEIENWIAFEPDPENMAALRNTAARLENDYGFCTLIQGGLADYNGKIAFSAGAGEASRMVRTSDETMATRIEVVRADDVVGAGGDIYIKLDIEGAEMAALRGMPNLLASKAALAVSIYHKPGDLWEIPLYLMQERADARIRIRQHGHHGFDTVLYVIPK